MESASLRPTPQARQPEDAVPCGSAAPPGDTQAVFYEMTALRAHLSPPCPSHFPHVLALVSTTAHRGSVPLTAAREPTVEMNSPHGQTLSRVPSLSCTQYCSEGP